MKYKFPAVFGTNLHDVSVSNTLKVQMGQIRAVTRKIIDGTMRNDMSVGFDDEGGTQTAPRRREHVFTVCIESKMARKRDPHDVAKKFITQAIRNHAGTRTSCWIRQVDGVQEKIRALTTALRRRCVTYSEQDVRWMVSVLRQVWMR